MNLKLPDLQTPVSPYLAGLGVPRIDEYFGLWCMEANRLEQSVERVNTMDLQGHVAQNIDRNYLDHKLMAESRTDRLAADIVTDSIQDGVAVISISGVMMKFVGSLTAGTSTILARKMFRKAASRADIRGVIARFDTPGGSVSGTPDLAAAIAECARAKPTVAFIEDCCCSAGIWASSQAGRVVANTATAIIGSIGVLHVLYDFSGNAAMRGIKAIAVTNDDAWFKGAGVPGTVITPEQVAEIRKLANGAAAAFIAGVASGRKMSVEKIKALADGRVWMAEEARSLGLIDGIQSFEKTLADLQVQRPQKKERTMSQQDGGGGSALADLANEGESGGGGAAPARKAASLAELKEALCGSDAGFREQCMERGLTLGEAQREWSGEQGKRLAASEAERKKLEAAARGPKPLSALAPARGAGGPEDGDEGEVGGEGGAREAYDAAVRKKMAAGMARPAACTAVQRGNPDLHKRFLLETQSSKRGQRIVQQMYEDAEK